MSIDDRIEQQSQYEKWSEKINELMTHRLELTDIRKEAIEDRGNVLWFLGRFRNKLTDSTINNLECILNELSNTIDYASLFINDIDADIDNAEYELQEYTNN